METRAVIFFLALLAVSHAATSTQILDSLPYFLFAIITTMIISLGMGYMLGSVLHAPQMLAWVRSEVREMVVAAILFMVVMGLFSSSNYFVQTLTGVPQATYEQQAQDTLDAMRTGAVNAYYDIIKAYHLVAMRSGYSTNLAIGYLVYYTTGNAPYSGYAPFFTFLGQATAGLTNVLFVYHALGVLLTFFLAVGGKLIYFAFAARFIPFTRQLGSTLVALVIGAYIIFPVSIILLNYFHGTIHVPSPVLSPLALSKMEFSIPPGARFICGEWWIRLLVANLGEIGFALPPCLIVALLTWGAGFAPCWNIMTAIVYPIVSTAIVVAFAAMMIQSSLPQDVDVQTVFLAMQPFLIDVNNLVVVSYIDALLVGIITISGTRAVAMALGGEYMLPGIQRLV